MTISTLPTAPAVTDSQATFNSRAFAWVAALDTFVSETNAAASEVSADAATASAAASAASASASTATNAANAASASANATLWVSGTTYSVGQCVYSPSTYQTYRRKTNGAGATDPASDSTNWAPLSADLTSGPTINNPTLGNTDLKAIRTATFYQQVNNATTTGAVTIDWTAGQFQKQAEPTGGITYTFTAPAGPCHLQLIIDSDGTSTAQTITWPASVVWMGAVWSGVNNKKAIVNFYFDGTNYFAVGTNQV